MTRIAELAESISTLLKGRSETVGVSESSSGGLVSAALLAVPGASAYFMGGMVGYTGAARDAFAQIDLNDHPGVRSSSEPFALLCANAARTRLGTTWGLAETGAAGPTGNRYGDAAGHACIALVGPVEETLTVETGSADREANMWTFTQTALELLAKAIEKNVT